MCHFLSILKLTQQLLDSGYAHSVCFKSLREKANCNCLSKVYRISCFSLHYTKHQLGLNALNSFFLQTFVTAILLSKLFDFSCFLIESTGLNSNSRRPEEQGGCVRGLRLFFDLQPLRRGLLCGAFRGLCVSGSKCFGLIYIHRDILFCRGVRNHLLCYATVKCIHVDTLFFFI